MAGRGIAVAKRLTSCGRGSSEGREHGRWYVAVGLLGSKRLGKRLVASEMRRSQERLIGLPFLRGSLAEGMSYAASWAGGRSGSERLLTATTDAVRRRLVSNRRGSRIAIRTTIGCG